MRARAPGHLDHRVMRERFAVAHLDIDVVSHPDDGTFFGLRARHVPGAGPPPELSSGPVPAQMARELRALAHRLDQIAAMRRRGGSGDGAFVAQSEPMRTFVQPF